MRKVFIYFKIKHIERLEKAVLIDKLIAHFNHDEEKYRLNSIAARVLRFKIYRLKQGLK